jgi:hypothetical protein
MRVSPVPCWLLSFVLLLIQPFHAYGSVDLTGCGTSKQCLKRPSGCTSDCNAIATWADQGDAVRIELWRKGSMGWVAMGLSPTGKMGPTNVLECIQKADDINVVRIGNSFSSAINTNAEGTVYEAGITNTSYDTTDGELTCRFTRQKMVPGDNGGAYDVTGQTYTILLGTGPSTTATPPKKNQHDVYPLQSPSKMSLEGVPGEREMTTKSDESSQAAYIKPCMNITFAVVILVIVRTCRCFW